MSENKKQLFTALGILIPAVVASVGYVGKLRLDVNSMNRDLSELRVKDYRQHRDMLEEHLRYGRSSHTALKRAMEENPDSFGASGRYRLESLKDSIELNREKLENYVEENKHYGK